MEGESNNISNSRLMNGVLDEHNGQCTKNVEGLPMDLALNYDVVDVEAALRPVFPFGKQIGWTKTKRGNEV
ncbi:hypothetical protein RDI58_028970 [Solanum bulbocastanum]|uniref:Uncharacterized protein n=1 Tax=Solanum bulbocastanum TaxID=147425 RepID=A0AAN8SVZ9_SOLBU